MIQDEIENIFSIFKNGLPKFWDGKECILYMKNNGCKNWRQMEWVGFYFQFMCETLLGANDYMRIPGPKYGNVEFDGFKIIPWDFKAHCMKKDKPDNGKIPTNGQIEILNAIHDYGNIGFIIISGYSDYDDNDLSFKKWHDVLKGGISKYELSRIERKAKPRKRKINFKPNEIIFVFLDRTNVNSCGNFQFNFRNSDGSPRKTKIMFDLDKNKSLKLYRYKF